MRIFLTGALLALAACGSAPPPADALTLLVESPPETLDRRYTLSANGQKVAMLVCAGLARIGDDSRPEPDLAESIAPEGDRVVVARLREGLRFSDGRPLTADDVVFTYRSILDPAQKSPHAQSYRVLERVEAVDPRTVRFTLHQPSAPFLGDLVMGIVPAGAEGEAFGRAPVCAGPFMVERWEDEEHLLLRANPHYWRGPVAVPRLHVLTVRDETTRVLELLKGRADLTVNTLSPAVLPAVANKPRLRVLPGPGSGFAYLGFNLEDPALKDVRVRRAIALGIDRVALVRFKFRGLARPAASMVPAGHWAAADLPAAGFDPAAARALLDQAGFPDPPGPAPRLTLTYKTSTDRFRRAIALVIARQLQEIGIAVEVRAYEWGIFFGDVKSGRFQLFSLKWATVIDPDLLRLAFHSENVPTAENGFGGGNRVRLRDAALDQLLDRGRGALDPESRRGPYAEAQARVAELVPIVPLWHEDTVAVVSTRVKDFRPSPHGFFDPLLFARLAP